MLQRITPDRHWPLHNAALTRQIEHAGLAMLPAHTLMARAGVAVARLARALYPHARDVWIACGPGNNGGDGLVAARELAPWAAASGARVAVSWQGDLARLPPDAAWALQAARDAGVCFVDGPPPDTDLAIDALFGLGGQTRDTTEATPLDGWLRWLRHTPQPVLCVDLPSGLAPDSGAWPGHTVLPAGPRHTLSLLTLKPGLFTASGRDAAGEVWLDDLGCGATVAPSAWLGGRAPSAPRLPHVSHKGSRGDVIVVGGQDMAHNGAGMTGAAVLAARASLLGGAGRVYLVPLGAGGPDSLRWDPQTPELMLRRPALLTPETLSAASVVCGCGGGQLVAEVLPLVIAHSRSLVLDADALNHLALSGTLREAVRERAATGRVTAITPHPLEAARLLGSTTAQVQAQRLRAAQTLADELQCVCVLKGSGSVIAAPGQVPVINPTGNARLATAGTGDVLAGLLGAALAAATDTAEIPDRVCAAVHQHGHLADHWDEARDGSLTADRLASRLHRL